jgi:hypothetical protein
MTSSPQPAPSRLARWFASPWLTAALLILGPVGIASFRLTGPTPALPEFTALPEGPDEPVAESEPPPVPATLPEEVARTEEGSSEPERPESLPATSPEEATLRTDASSGSEPGEPILPAEATRDALARTLLDDLTKAPPGWEQFLPAVARPAREAAPAAPGVLWSVPAFPAKTAAKDVIGLVLDPDRRHVYTFGHVHAAPIHDPKVFLCRWRGEDGRLLWANRLPADGLPATHSTARHLAVPTHDLPIPRATMVWMIEKRTGGITGWLASPRLSHLRWWEDKLLGGFSDPGEVEDPLNHRYTMLSRITREADQIQLHTTRETGVHQVVRYPLGLDYDTVATGVNRGVVLAGGKDKLIHIWDHYTVGERPSREYARHQHPITLIRYAEEALPGREPPRVLSVAFPEVHIWDFKTQDLLVSATLPVEGVTCVEISPNWRYALLGNERGEVCVVDLATGEQVGEAIPAHTGPVTVTVFAPDWRTAFSVGREDGRLCRLGLPTLE